MTTALADIQFDETEVLARVCRLSLFEFVQEFWPVICAEKPVWNWHIPYLCGELEEIARRCHAGAPKEYDLVINISPGETKSILVSIMFPAWVWTWWPSTSFIGSSYTYDLAVNLSRKNRAIVKSEKYQSCFPETKIIADQDAKGHFINVCKGERMCAGIDGDIIGRHADFILIDDPLKPKGARSEAELKSANVFITETLWSRKKDKAVVPTILIMQRLHQNDPSGMILERFKGAVKHIRLPAVLSKKVNPPELREFYRDGLMDPLRLNNAVLDEERKLGDFYFAGQFMQDPIPVGGGIFKAEKIEIVDAAPRSLMTCVRYWDNAGTKGGGAYTAGAKLGKNCDGRFYILHMVRGQWDASVRDTTILQTAKTDGVDTRIGVEQEPGSSGKDVAEAIIRKLAGFRAQADRPTGDKELRADPFAAQVNIGNVYMVRGDWNRALLDEMSYFPASTYKDQVDSLSGAFKLLTQPMITVGAW